MNARHNKRIRLRIDLGRAHFGVDDAGAIAPGAIVQLSAGPMDDVEVHSLGVDGEAIPSLLARGELTDVSGKLGVRVREVARPNL